MPLPRDQSQTILRFAARMVGDSAAGGNHQYGLDDNSRTQQRRDYRRLRLCVMLSRPSRRRLRRRWHRVTCTETRDGLTVNTTGTSFLQDSPAKHRQYSTTSPPASFSHRRRATFPTPTCIPFPSLVPGWLLLTIFERKKRVWRTADGTPGTRASVQRRLVRKARRRRRRRIPCLSVVVAPYVHASSTATQAHEKLLAKAHPTAITPCQPVRGSTSGQENITVAKHRPSRCTAFASGPFMVGCPSFCDFGHLPLLLSLQIHTAAFLFYP
ncbi:hypothetical protein IWZ00DRAFT_375469 [Phyllosticta capitalensis]